MNKNPMLLAAALCMMATSGVIHAQGSPRIQFTQTVFDFGKTSQVASVSGVFLFKNIGDGVLKVEPPKPSCGCTVAKLNPDTLPPGATGELPFTLHFGQVKALLELHIAVHSNDPLSPEVLLTVRADYTPLFDFNPPTLSAILPFGVDAADLLTTLTRTDGQPLRITRLDTSHPWMKATVDPDSNVEAVTARIRIAIRREGPPRRFNEFVYLYTRENSNSPASSISIQGQFAGEVSLSPESLYWYIDDEARVAPERPEATVLRRVTIRSAGGRPIEFKNPQSAVKGIKLELVPREAGKFHELVARLDELPASTVIGTVSFETSLAAQPKIEVPVIVHVSPPPSRPP